MADGVGFSSKTAFLQKDFITLLESIESTEKGKWGVMNGQQMVEHMIEVFRIANGQLAIPLVTPADRLDKFREFLFSEKEFRENTKSPILGEEPSPLKFSDMETAIAELKRQVIDFFQTFANNPSLQTLNPIFGELDFKGNIQLLYKHAIHHLRQFNRVN